MPWGPSSAVSAEAVGVWDPAFKAALLVPPGSQGAGFPSCIEHRCPCAHAAPTCKDPYLPPHTRRHADA